MSDSEARKPLTLDAGNLAAISFRAKDALNAACAMLDGKQIPDGGALWILVRVPVAYTEAGQPHAGDFQTKTKIHDAAAEADRAAKSRS